MAKNYHSLIAPIREALSQKGDLRAMLGFDGTVDVICKPVELRKGTGDNFSAFHNMRDFGQRVVDADGKSAIVEIVKKREKFGGNGPIMAAALAGAGVVIDYIGPLGQPEIHPAYEAFAQKIKVHSIAQPAVTHALEFSNGKLMLSSVSTYDQIDAANLQQQIGNNTMVDLIRNSRLCCLLNWTCLPGFKSILIWYLETLLPTIGVDKDRIFFFDLADPSMHSDDELMEVLSLVSGFAAFGRVTLGMNLNETQQVCRTLRLAEPAPEAEPLCEALQSIREKLGVHTTMAHPTDFAACATPEGTWSVDGPHTESPLITTGAGDHLNAGFCLGQLLDFSPKDSLKLGVLFSGYYVRQAKSPTLESVLQFISELETA